MQQVFDVAENNIKIKEYIEYRKEKMKPQRYVFNISLKGFDKEIKRKISINNNVTINEFCKNIVLSMNGDLSHGYGIKISGEFLNEYYDGVKLYYLNLKEKKKLKIIYDWGDGWTFNVTVSKIIDNYGDEECEVLSGKGYGIVDDCGGIWALKKIFAGEDKSWGDYDINDFDLEKCNNIIRKNS